MLYLMNQELIAFMSFFVVVNVGITCMTMVDQGNMMWIT